MSVIEKTALLRYAKLASGIKMASKKSCKRPLRKNGTKENDLLKLSDAERMKTLKTLKESLKQKIVEAKMWNSFLKLESLVINGQTVFCETNTFEGFSFRS
jgi:hypothetical protein